MRPTIFLLISVILVVNSGSQYCEPKDEFPDDNSDTADTEWDLFMDKLDQVTLKKNYTKPCKRHPDQQVVINASSPILWELRFDLYNKRQQKEEKTIEQCYSENQGKTPNTGCNTEGFRECMKSARRAMLEDLNSKWWESKINKKLEEKAEAC
ncbi:hypothetical protein TcasGA2_TC015483 [Tribolium castaneum]|uniref:Uncharacterized protein n=1 Tax=Tribolium castaneum TaxID=7070 RepID=D6WWV1_TRICA|nr:PREDICTED: uncharacterized protein LOC103313362 [Tribolium castaneum]EFA09108.1 hypothetical protein TcasGA2_TC015483 [Tribolium castaneum]|eukprot:XP_008194623.1 PREDICTED: uncharacterized protein LOC103313362 [Tribolium castaneum]